MRIHICLISSSRLDEARYGGESRFTTSLAEWLFAHRYPVTLIGTTFSGVRAKFMTYESRNTGSRDECSVKVRIDKPKAIYPPYFVYSASRLVISLKALVEIIRIHRAKKISVIHAQDTGYSGLAAIVAGKLLKLPVVISTHGIRHVTIASQNTGFLSRFIVKLEYRLDLFCVRRSHGLIAANPFIEKYYKDLLPKSFSKIQFIPIPIRVSNFKFNGEDRVRVRNEFGISSDSILIGFVGRFAGVKNLVSLLEAFAEVSGVYPTMHLLLVGAGKQEQDLKDLARARGIQNAVIFAGLRADIARILSALDIFVLPSLSEGLSTSLLEAMAAGRAIICSNIPGNTLLVRNGENGITVSPRNRDEIKAALVRLASDINLRARIGSAAAQIAMRYDEENIFPLLEKYYKQVIEKANSTVNSQ